MVELDTLYEDENKLIIVPKEPKFKDYFVASCYKGQKYPLAVFVRLTGFSQQVSKEFLYKAKAVRKLKEIIIDTYQNEYSKEVMNYV